MNENKRDTRRPITLEDKALLLESIEAAEGPGACEYVAKDRHGGLRPCCVVGQFAFRKGASLSHLSLREGDSADMLAEENERKGGAILELLGFPRNLLSSVQQVWDTHNAKSVSERRAEMREVVNGWPVVGGKG